MKTIRYACPKEFLRTAEAFLMENEAVNSLPLGIALNLASGESPTASQSFLAVVHEHNVVRMVLIMTTSHLVLAGEDNREAVSAAIDYLSANEVQIPSIIGTRKLADIFAESWSREKRTIFTREMGQRIYRLDSVNPVPKASGFLRTAQPEDLKWLPKWINEFAQEALNPIVPEQAQVLAETGITQHSIFLWQDGNEAVSMAKKSRPTPNGISVSLVYTPREYRGRGYATSCVAALSQNLLDQGYSFCSLYTDLANPTSNKIYTDIGYKPIEDSVVYHFS